METAIQKVNQKYIDMGEYEFSRWLHENLDELLATEREQLYQAFVAGDERGTGDIPFNCEQYYQQKYGSK